MVDENFKNQFAFTPEENHRFARMSFTKLVHTNDRFDMNPNEFSTFDEKTQTTLNKYIKGILGDTNE